MHLSSSCSALLATSSSCGVSCARGGQPDPFTAWIEWRGHEWIGLGSGLVFTAWIEWRGHEWIGLGSGLVGQGRRAVQGRECMGVAGAAGAAGVYVCRLLPQLRETPDIGDVAHGAGHLRTKKLLNPVDGETRILQSRGGGAGGWGGEWRWAGLDGVGQRCLNEWWCCCWWRGVGWGAGCL